MKEIILKVLEESITEEKIEKMVEKHLEESINAVLKDTFGSYGSTKKIIQEKVEESMETILKGYNFDNYLPRLTNIIDGAMENFDKGNKHRTLLDNIKTMFGFEIKDTFTLRDIMNNYKKFVKVELDTEDIEDFDASEYEGFSEVDLDVTYSIEEGEYTSLKNHLISMSITSDNVKDKEEFDVELSLLNSGRIYYIRGIDNDKGSVLVASPFYMYLDALNRNNSKLAIETEDTVEDVIEYSAEEYR